MLHILGHSPLSVITHKCKSKGIGGDFLSCFTTEVIAIVCLFLCGLSSIKNIFIASTEQKHQRQRQNKNSQYQLHHIS